jgi:very-short-patch-repair endonuclease
MRPTRGEGRSGSPPVPQPPPSPLVGEGGARSATDEGAATRTSSRAFARHLRRNSTEAERALWRLLRDRRLADCKFRRQVPIGPYVADFICYPARLIVELDGSQHAESTSDKRRDADLARRGFTILRVWNNELTHNRQGVLEAIWSALVAHPSSVSALRAEPPSPTRGEGRDGAPPAPRPLPPHGRNRPPPVPQPPPSPLVGEGGARSATDEGAATRADSRGESQ